MSTTLRSTTFRSTRFRTIPSLLVATALIAAACGGTDTATDSPDAGSDSSTSSTSEAPDESTTSTDAPAETTTTTSTATTTAPLGEDGDSGEPLDFGPIEGQELAVVNVRYDDELNFRAGPGTGEAIVRSMAPLVDTPPIIAAGEAWIFDSSVWWKVTIEGEELWANQSFLSMLGKPTSIFAEVAIDPTLLEGTSLEDMAEAIAATRWNEEPAPSVVFSGEPLGFDDGNAFAIVDIVGFLDDSVLGERLRINVEFDVPDPEAAEPETTTFRVTDVIATPLCARGVSDGLCL